MRETGVSAPRGTIYDRNGVLLAMSAGVDTVYLSPAEIERGGEDAEAIARGLAEILGLDYESVYAKTQTGPAPGTRSWPAGSSRRRRAEVRDSRRRAATTA